MTIFRLIFYELFCQTGKIYLDTYLKIEVISTGFQKVTEEFYKTVVTKNKLAKFPCFFLSFLIPLYLCDNLV